MSVIDYNLIVTIEADNPKHFPGTGELANGIWEGLPKEWFTQDTEGDRYAITSIGYSTGEGPVVDWEATAVDREKIIQSTMKRNIRLASELDQEKKLTAHLEAAAVTDHVELRGLRKANGRLNAEANKLTRTRTEVQAKYDDSLLDWKSMQADRDRYREMYDNRSVAIQASAAQVRRLQDEAKVGRIAADNNDATIKQLQGQLTNANLEAQNHANMIAKIVGAMTAAGYDISGWGNDSQLSDLEAFVGDTKASLEQVGQMIDEIRTER